MAKYKGKQYYSPKRRAKYRQGDDIDHLTLFHLYGWICNICNGSIAPHRRFPDVWAATVDHIVPLSAGGTHTWDNVAPAHARCNFDKASEPKSCDSVDNAAMVVLDWAHAG